MRPKEGQMTDRVDTTYQSDDEDLVGQRRTFVREDITAEPLDIEPWGEPVQRRGSCSMHSLASSTRYLSLEGREAAENPSPCSPSLLMRSTFCRGGNHGVFLKKAL